MANQIETEVTFSPETLKLFQAISTRISTIEAQLKDESERDDDKLLTVSASIILAGYVEQACGSIPAQGRRNIVASSLDMARLLRSAVKHLRVTGTTDDWVKQDNVE